MINLSEDNVSSFCGDVIPLWLVSDSDLSQEDITWGCDSDIVAIHRFSGCENYGFNHGILLTLANIGTTVVWATYKNEKFICSVNIREMKKFTNAEAENFYIGDLHIHTSLEHGHEEFAVRTSGFPIDCINQIKDENLLDFSVISDHSDTLNKKDFFRGFTDAKSAEPMELVVFPGSESEVNIIEHDRYGLQHKNSGEIVSLNTSAFVNTDNWEEFYFEMQNNPLAVCILAHPQIVGFDQNGVWNFSLDKNRRLSNYVRLVEMGNGSDRESNMINEYVYSLALDNGFKVSVCCSSDCHGPVWGYHVFPGKTVIKAAEKTKEAFLDSLLSNRVYACESGNLKLSYKVNSNEAPCTLHDTDTYHFEVDISYFKDDLSTVPVKCDVISDYGCRLKTLENINFDSFEFNIKSESARYFYLRFTDIHGRRTWSPPVWTGRAIDEETKCGLSPVSKSDISATDLISGENVRILVSDNPLETWNSSCNKAEIVLDMNTAYNVCALGHYAPRIDRKEVREKSLEVTDLFASFAHEYRLSTSLDGITYNNCVAGIIRNYGGEEIITFPAHDARYIKFEVISTVGKEYGISRYKQAKLLMSELTPYTLN